MQLAEVCAALAAIDHRKWGRAGSKWPLVTMIAAHNDWMPGEAHAALGVRGFVEIVGMDKTWTSRQLRELIDERVLLLERAAAGSHGNEYAVNPTLRAWRVPWRVPLAQVELHLDLLSGRLVVHEEAFVSRHRATQSRFTSRHGATGNGHSGNGVAPSRDRSALHAARHGATQMPDRLSTTDRGPGSSTFAYLSAASEQQQESASRIIGAIERRTKGSLFGHQLRLEVLGWAQRLSAEQVDQLCAWITAFTPAHFEQEPGPPLMVLYVRTKAWPRLLEGDSLTGPAGPEIDYPAPYRTPPVGRPLLPDDGCGDCFGTGLAADLAGVTITCACVGREPAPVVPGCDDGEGDTQEGRP